jgi:hypothetical protein
MNAGDSMNMKQSFAASLSLLPFLFAPHSFGVEGEEIRREAKSFDRCFVSNPKEIEAIKTANNIGKHGNGWFDYDIKVKDGGWYELLIEPSAAGHEVLVDGGNYTYSNNPKAGNYYLKPGIHTVRIQGLHHSGLREMTSFIFRPSEDKLGKRIRIESPERRDFFVVGEKIRLQVTHGSTALISVLKVRVTDRAGEAVAQSELKLSAGPDVQASMIEFIVRKEGTMTASFSAGDEFLSPEDCPPFTFDVIDDTPPPATKVEEAKKLIREIDCAEKEPDYTGGREASRVITKSFGRYRESGKVGWLQNFNDKDPSWFAYAVTLPEIQKLYLIEVDYPDDALRTFCISLKSDVSSSYPITGGVDSGGEFRLTNTMQTQSLYLWARSVNLRVVMIVPNTGYRAAASKIRIYEVQGNPQPAVRQVSGGRNFVNWFEEGASMFGMYAAPEFQAYNNWKTQDAVISTDRFCQLLSYMGGDSLIYTMAIYQFGMYPSRYNVSHNGLYTTDIVGRMILKCQKYGIRFYGEFHPEARELAWNADSGNPFDPIFAINVKGKKRAAANEPIYNPLHPKNQEWYVGMLKEFADRYARFPGFQGISLRIMTWCNPGLNNFQNLDWGYDDYSVSLFQRETGISVPRKDNDPGRFYGRYLFLSGPQRERWIRWRCDKITDLHKRVVQEVKKARPDLEVCLNIFGLSSEKLPLAGLDTKALDAVGVRVINSACNYGRHPSNNVQDVRDRMLDPIRLKSMNGGTSNPSYLYSGHYFEATEKVLTPASLGFPADTPTGWISGVVNPAGDSFLERYALSMAEADAGMLGDGGNTYTLGQPMLREFTREFRVLPNKRFTPRPDARDPAAVWELNDSDKFYFYAVNRERYPTKLSIRFATEKTEIRHLSTLETAKTDGGFLKLTLKPFQLLSFQAGKGTSISAVETEIPDAEMKKARAQVQWLAQLAEDIRTDRNSLGLDDEDRNMILSADKEAEERFAKKEVWRIRTMLENNRMLELWGLLNRFPPYLRDTGLPVAPLDAFKAQDMVKMLPEQVKASMVASETVAPEWIGEKLMQTEADSFTLATESSTTSRCRITIGHLSGGDYGAVAVKANGQLIGSLPGAAATVQATVTVLPQLVVLQPGTTKLEFTRTEGNKTGLCFVQLTPIFRDLVSRYWHVAGPFMIADSFETAKLKEALDHDPFPQEQVRDFAKEYDLGNGRKGKWILMQGDADFVDFNKAFHEMKGALDIAITYIYSDTEQTVSLNYGMDYWLKILVNGEVAVDFAEHSGPPFKGQFKTTMKLKKGWNELMVKVVSGTLGNGFWLSISDPGGLKIANVPE